MAQYPILSSGARDRAPWWNLRTVLKISSLFAWCNICISILIDLSSVLQVKTRGINGSLQFVSVVYLT